MHIISPLPKRKYPYFAFFNACNYKNVPIRQKSTEWARNKKALQLGNWHTHTAYHIIARIIFVLTVLSSIFHVGILDFVEFFIT